MQEKKMKRLTATVLILLLSFIPLMAQMSSSGEIYHQTLSPLLLGQGMDLTSHSTPQMAGINPASPGFFQRNILDANYINISPVSGEFSGMGHIANLAMSVPSAYGVFTGALHFQDWSSLAATDLNFGSSFTANLAFSKELYDDLFFGFGLNGGYQWSSGDWGASLSAGVIYLPGDLWGLKNVSLAGSVSHFGKTIGTEERGILAGVPEMVTPMAGLSFDVLQKEKAGIRLFSTLSVPSLSDLKLDSGASISMGDSLTLNTSISADMLDIINGNYQTVIPSLSMNVNLPLTPKSNIGNRLQTSELNLQAGGKLLYNGALAAGAGITMPFGVRDKEAPELDLTYENDQYISPNYDGTQDELTLPLAVSEDRYIQGYEFSIYNEEGDLVRRIYNKDDRPENSTFGSLFQRLKTPRTSVPVPESFRWDGMTEEGEIAPDGTYTFQVEIWDDNRNTLLTEPQTFVVDGTKPEASMQKPEGAALIFSPDGDGHKDQFELPQSGSPEDKWIGEVKDKEGNVVKTFTWEDSEPGTMTWDGTDDEGEVLPDGVYQYSLSTTDRAGNIKEESVNNILINTVQPEIKLTLDHAYLSPGNINARDRIFLGLDLSTVAGLSEWKLDIVNSSGTVQKSWTDRGDESIIRNGTVEYKGERDGSGFLEEGLYKARFTGRYQNGFTPEVYSPEFTVDTTAPTAQISVSPRTFSPDGDGRQDEVVFRQTTSNEENWRGVLLDENDQIVQEFQWRGNAQAQLNWNGQDKNGKIRSVTEPREYSYYLEATDQAGNHTQSDIVPFIFDNSQVEFLLSVDQDAFSPNGDGVKDRLNISMQQVGSSPVEQFKLYLIDESEQEVLVLQQGVTPPASMGWNGEGAEDGRYQVRIDLEYSRGDKLTMTSPEFLIDRIYPEIELSSSATLISPNGDGHRDQLDLTQRSSEEELFEAQLLDLGGKVLNSWFWHGQLENFKWGGVDESGNVLANGVYRYKVASQDAAGNRTEKTIENIQIDNRRSDIFLTVSREIFSPGGREGSRNQDIQMITTLKDGIDRWELNLVHSEQGVVKSWSGTTVPPEKFIWDGRSDSDRLIEGEYTASAAVYYTKGDQPKAETTPFMLDSSAPSVSLRLEPLPFSPDDDNVDDELVLSMAVRDLSPIEGWSMVIDDPRGKEFISFSGQGKPTQRIIWDGRSNRGELVQSAEDYSYTLTVTDIMGNTTTEEGVIPVDVLVVRDGDRLKILISNITFEPEKPTLTSDAKNMEVLARIAEILDKYRRYRVIVEGHANPVLGTQAEKAVLSTLSEQRAETVMNILIDLGVSEDRLGYVGRGGEATLANPRDREENWKNRRVEFILEK